MKFNLEIMLHKVIFFFSNNSIGSVWATLLLISGSLFFSYLVKDVIVILLSNTHELTVIYFGSHDALVVQFLHCWRDTKTGK